MAPAATPSSPPPPSPTWTSLPPTAPARSGMVSLSVPSLSFWARAIGFLLLFVGTIVAVSFATITGNCYTGTPPTCGSGFISGAANAVIAAKILWSIGLFFLGAGAGIKMHWGLGKASSATSDEVRAMIHDRWMNALLVVLSVVLLWFLLAGAGSFLTIP